MSDGKVEKEAEVTYCDACSRDVPNSEHMWLFPEKGPVFCDNSALWLCQSCGPQALLSRWGGTFLTVNDPQFSKRAREIFGCMAHDNPQPQQCTCVCALCSMTDDLASRRSDRCGTTVQQDTWAMASVRVFESDLYFMVCPACTPPPRNKSLFCTTLDNGVYKHWLANGLESLVVSRHFKLCEWPSN